MTQQRTFDYVPRHDPRSLSFVVTDHFASDKPIKSRARRHFGPYLDQGSEGACVGFGTANSLAVTPKRRKDVTDEMARAIYRQAQRVDEWEGENYSGTSVLAGMKTAQSFGYIKAYYWATNLRQMQTAVAHVGPLVIGVNWYSGMFNTDSNGFLQVTGNVEGGHCVTLVGVDLKKEAFVLQNSWGEDWGVQSRALLSFADTERLVIHEHGEAAVFKK